MTLPRIWRSEGEGYFGEHVVADGHAPSYARFEVEVDPPYAYGRNDDRVAATAFAMHAMRPVVTDPKQMSDSELARALRKLREP